MNHRLCVLGAAALLAVACGHDNKSEAQSPSGMTPASGTQSETSPGYGETSESPRTGTGHDAPGAPDTTGQGTMSGPESGSMEHGSMEHGSMPEGGMEPSAGGTGGRGGAGGMGARGGMSGR